MTIDLGPIQFDPRIVLPQLQRDLKDDWFPDPLRFEDMFRADRIAELIAENFRRNHGVYHATTRTLLNVPKKNFTLRYSLETGIADRALYHAITSFLVPHYDPLLSWRVFSHRHNQKKGPHRYLFRQAIPVWRDFVGAVKVASKKKGVLLSTDLANYFEDINNDTLQRTMLDLLSEITGTPADKATIRAHLDSLFSCLREWCYQKSSGLPQNRDASSFLGNIYLVPVDRAMLARGYEYFRYMDDIKIACSDVFQARRALKELSIELRKLGLSVNSGKTQICSASDEELNGCLDSGGSELQQLDGIWKSQSLKTIARSFPMLRSMTERLLRTDDVESRSFRFCIKRLEILAQCPEFAAPAEFFAPITQKIIEALPRHPAATDQFVKYLGAVPTADRELDRLAMHLQDQGKNFYTWQNYRLWKLLVEKKYVSGVLLAHALEVVRTSEDDANRCGATLYLGAFGEKATRIVVAERFNGLNSFLGQRTALIAVQELHYKPYIEKYVQPHLRDDLVGVFRALNREGIYVARPEFTPITGLIDMERDYD